MPRPSEELVRRLLQASLARDATTLRSCLADSIDFDWGVIAYTDPDAFVSAVVGGKVEWRGFTQLAAMFEDDRAAVFYEGFNDAEGVYLRTAEYLRIEGGLITDALVVFSQTPIPG